MLVHPLLRLVLPVVPPSRQRRPALDQIAHTPQHALLVRGLGDVVIRTEDIELPLSHPGFQIFNDLLREPRPLWLFVTWPAAAGESGECPPGNEEVDANLRVGAEIIVQMFGEGFYGRFRRVVGGVSRRVCDALFGARDYNGSWGSLGGCGLDSREKGSYAVDDPE